LWSRLCDTFPDNKKIIAAGDQLGKHGPALAITMYVVALVWSNRQLTDGFLPLAVVKQFHQVEDPQRVAKALVAAKLWDAAEGGYQIHDFADWNFTAAQVQAKRLEDRERKKKNGHVGGKVSGRIRHGVR